MKVELYRRLGRLRSLERLADFRQELIDRFGPLPPPGREPADRGRAAHPGRALAARADPRRGRVRRPDLPQRRSGSRPWPGSTRGRVRIVDEKTAYVPLGDEKRPHGSVVAGVLKPLLEAPV